MAEAPRDGNRVPTITGVSDVDGITPVPIHVDPATGGVLISGSITGSDGAITDGVDADIKATVLDYTNSNPVAVRLTDTNGDYIAAGAGTQYTEDAAAAGNPIGNALIVVRDDARSGTLTNADGDNVAVRGTNAGEMYVKHVDAIPVTDNAGSLTVDNEGITTIAGAVAGTEMQVDVVAALPAGTNNIGDVDILSIAAGDNNIGNVDVVTLPSLPAGTNAIGKLAANSGVDIGDVDVLSVVPGTGATNLGKAEDAAHTTGDVGVMALAVRKDTAAASSGTTGDYEPLSTDATGRLWIVGAAVEDAAETAGGTLLMAGSVRRDTAASSAGTTGDNATINTDSVGALWTRSTGELADDAAFTPGTSRVLPVGLIADETSTDSVDEGDVGAARMTLDRKAIVTLQPHTAGGLTTFRSIDLDESEEEVKATAGNLYGYYFANTNASARYLKLYNATAANVTVGTTTPSHTFYLPPTSAGHVSFPVPIGFSTALSAAATTGVADNDTGAPGANEVIFMAFYA